MVQCSETLRAALDALRPEDFHVPEGPMEAGERLLIPGDEVPEDFRRACTLIRRGVDEWNKNQERAVDPVVFEAHTFSKALLATFSQTRGVESAAVCRNWDIAATSRKPDLLSSVILRLRRE